MSPERSGPGGVLIAQAKAGDRILVSDSSGAEVARGADRIRLDLPAGLYAVAWTTGGQESETLVRILPGRKAIVRPQPADAAVTRGQRFKSLAALSDMAPPPGCRPSWTGTALVVQLEATNELDIADLLQSIQLIDGNNEPVEALDTRHRGFPEGSKIWTAVTAGRYRLRFHALAGEALDLTVPVLRNRRTFVRLRAAKADLLTPDGEHFVRTASVGIEPARTVIVTALASERPDQLEEPFRIAELLLRDLAAGTGSLSRGVLAHLKRHRRDPLLETFAAMVALNCLEREISPAPGESHPRRMSRGSKTENWRARAAYWLRNAKRAGMPPDATAGLWQLEASGRKTRRRADSPRNIQLPPMLECAWRWAIARSTVDSTALQAHAAIRAAARSAGGTTPWLCWQQASAKAINATSSGPSRSRLESLVSQVAEMTRQVRQKDGRSAPVQVLPESIPAEVAAIALNAEELVHGRSRLPASADLPLAASLSISLALPQAALGTRLSRAVELLGEALAGDATDAVSKGLDGLAVASPARDAPGWSERVKDKEDPNRGRFGGAAVRQGFGLEAGFEMTKSRNWATIHLALRGPAEDGETAILYLHDSFRPMRRELRFEAGSAELKVTAWGGFTVGAWIPSRAIALELDLASIRGAPRIIRER